jgi:phage gpG-like protein
MLKGEAILNPRVRDLESLFRLDGGDMQRITERVDTTFRKQSSQVFATEGSAGGERWEPLSPGYAKSKQKKFPGRKILQRKGKLRRSLVNKGADHVAFGYTEPQPTVEVGTADPVAAYHAPGRFHNPNLPVRDPIQRTPAQRIEMSERMKDYIVTVKLPRLLRALEAGAIVAGLGRRAGGGRA